MWTLTEIISRCQLKRNKSTNWIFFRKGIKQWKKKISAHHLYQETFQVRLLSPTQSINCYPQIWLNPLIYLSFAVLKYYFNKLWRRFNVSVLHVLVCHNLHKEITYGALIMSTIRTERPFSWKSHHTTILQNNLTRRTRPCNSQRKVCSTGFAGSQDLYMQGNVWYPLICSCLMAQEYLHRKVQ